MFDRDIEKLVLKGMFPKKELIPFVLEDYCDLDFKKLGKTELSLYEEDPEFSYQSFLNWWNAYEMTDISTCVEFINIPDLNTIINTGKLVFYRQKEFEFNPCITRMDWLLYVKILDSCILTPSDEIDKSILDSLLYAHIYILLTIQKKELESKKTLDLNKISNPKEFISILFGDWSKARKYYVDLADEEYARLKELFVKREQLIKEEKKRRSVSVKRIDHQREVWNAIVWNAIIRIYNEMGSLESSTIEMITQSTNLSASEKKKKIENYIRRVDLLCDKKYLTASGEVIDIKEVQEEFVKIMLDGYASCCIEEQEKDDLISGKKGLSRKRLNSIVSPITLLMIQEMFESPKTFNYLSILFHYFRINANKSSLHRFVDVALTYLKRNLDIKTECVDVKGTFELIQVFYKTVKSYFEQHLKVILQQKYNEIQEDAALVAGSETLLQDYLSNSYFEEIDKEDYGQIGNLIRNLVDNDQERAGEVLSGWLVDDVENRVEASQLLVSINIIYMFCSVLRIAITKGLIESSHVAQVEKIRKELLNIEETINQHAYSELSFNEKKMNAYREEKGIDYAQIAEREGEIEDYRREILKQHFTEYIEEICSNLDDENIEELMDIKDAINDEIKQLPICGESEWYADFVDRYVVRICDAIIKRCMNKKRGLNDTKISLMSVLGANHIKLSDKPKSSLVTAEYLYSKYASPAYADDFNYSCISALYYQSVESAFNELIWKKYADYLNNLCVGKKGFCEVLRESKEIELSAPDFCGYLDSDPGNRKYYTGYIKRKKYGVKEECVYGSFVKMLQQLNVKSKLSKWCEFFAREVVGFASCNDMFKDSVFMGMLAEFTNSMDEATRNRNRASHGGYSINLDQCTMDKKCVLDNVNQLRTDSLGLVQQLLRIVSYKG